MEAPSRLLLMEHGLGVEEAPGAEVWLEVWLEEGRVSVQVLRILRSVASSGVLKWGEAGERSSVRSALRSALRSAGSSSSHRMSWGVVRDSSTVLDTGAM